LLGSHNWDHRLQPWSLPGFKLWLLVDASFLLEFGGGFLGLKEDRFGGDSIGGFDYSEGVDTGFCELAHAFPRLRVVVTRAELEKEEILDVFDGIVGVPPIRISLDGDVRS
jgi:hypothetical protein